MVAFMLYSLPFYKLLSIDPSRQYRFGGLGIQMAPACVCSWRTPAPPAPRRPLSEQAEFGLAARGHFNLPAGDTVLLFAEDPRAQAVLRFKFRRMNVWDVDRGRSKREHLRQSSAPSRPGPKRDSTSFGAASTFPS